MADKEGSMTLRVLTPTGVSAETPCDSVRLTLRDDRNGRGGGSIGIRKGHADAVLALGRGPVRASLGSETVFRAEVEAGFASVKDNVVTVITDSARIEGQDSAGEEE